LAAARRSGLGGMIERIVLNERALQPAGHLAQNLEVRVAHARRLGARRLGR